MESSPLALPWNQPDWVEQAHGWIKHSLTEAGLTLTGPIDQFHTYAWSTVMRVPTDRGLYYFKAVPQEMAVEPVLTDWLNRRWPEQIPNLLAVDLERHWMLMPDSGVMLRTYLKSPDDLHILDKALPQFAEIQIDLVGQGQELLSMGVSDRRLELLPERFAALLVDMQAMRIGQEDGLSEAEHQRLLGLVPQYGEMCAQLGAFNVPLSLHHDDFHDGNIFVRGQSREQFELVFSDWEESCYTHPFFSMMLCLRSVAYRVGLPDETTATPEGLPPELARLRDIYLTPWQQFESAENLIPVFNLAWRVGMINRALTWYGYLVNLEGPVREKYAYTVPAWLQEFLLAMD